MKFNKYKLVIANLCLALCLSSVTSYAENGYYQWEDDRGTPQYSERPPIDRPYTFVPSKTGSGRSAKSNTNEPPAEAILPEKKTNPAFCERARTNLETLKSSAQIRVRDEDGGYRHLTDEEKEVEKQNARNQIDIHC